MQLPGATRGELLQRGVTCSKWQLTLLHVPITGREVWLKKTPLLYVAATGEPLILVDSLMTPS